VVKELKEVTTDCGELVKEITAFQTTDGKFFKKL
jgi:hypothetical protein